MRLADIAIQVFDETVPFDEPRYEALRKRFGNKRIDRLVQKADAAQRRAKMGRWK